MADKKVAVSHGPNFGLIISSPAQESLLTPGSKMDIKIYTTASSGFAHPTHLYITLSGYGGAVSEIAVAGLPMSDNYIVVPQVTVPAENFMISVDTFPDAVPVVYGSLVGATVVSPAAGTLIPLRTEFSVSLRADDPDVPISNVLIATRGWSVPIPVDLYGITPVDGVITISGLTVPIHSDRVRINADTTDILVEASYGYHDGVDIISPAAGEKIKAYTPFSIVVAPSVPGTKVNLVLMGEINITPEGGITAETSIPITREHWKYLLSSTGLGLNIQASVLEEYPPHPILGIVNLIHYIDPGSLNLAPRVSSGLIFPAGKWRFSQVGHIEKVRFAWGELLHQPQSKIRLTGGTWYRYLGFQNDFARYGNIDEGVPIYRWEEKDYGGGQVARWPVVKQWDHPWAEQIVPHLLRLAYDDITFDRPPLMDAVTWGVISRSTDAGLAWNSMAGGFSGLPTTGMNIAGAVSTIPYGPKTTRYEVYCDFVRLTANGYVINTPEGEKRIFHLYHVTKVNAEITPADGTALIEGQSVDITATPTEGNVLTFFSVDGSDVLATNPFTKTNVQADVYVSAMAIYEAPEATDGTPYSFQCSSDICGTQFWSATGLPPGLSINSSTGLISGTVPYDTAAGDYTATITLDNDGRVVTRQLLIHVNFLTEPVPGLAWEQVGKIGSGAVTALCQTSSGAILLGTSDAEIYRTTDLASFSLVDTAYGSITSIIQLASGTILASCYAGSSANLRRSTNDGVAWSDGAAAPWFSPTLTDLVESPAGTVLSLAMFGSAGRTDRCEITDDGMTLVDTGYFNAVSTQFGRIGVESATGKTLATVSGFGFANILRANDGASLAAVLTSGLSDVRVGPIVTLPDGRHLAAIHDRVYRGTADGTTWTLLQELPAWGGITTPAVIGCMFAGEIGGLNAVILCCKDALDGATVYRSVDGFENYTEASTPIDGDLSFKMIRLADGKMLMGTDGSTFNLWSSVAT